MFQIKRVSLTFKEEILPTVYATREEAAGICTMFNRARFELHVIVESEPVKGKSLEEVKALWRDLGNVPTNDQSEIETPFLHFPAGSDIFEVWAWFESQNEEFAVYDMMGFTE